MANFRHPPEEPAQDQLILTPDRERPLKPEGTSGCSRGHLILESL
jgi:hypothetical protein